MWLVMFPALMIICFVGLVCWSLLLIDGVKEIEIEWYEFRFGPYPHIDREQVFDLIQNSIMDKTNK